MKRLFRRIAEFFGFKKPKASIVAEQKSVDKTFCKQKISDVKAENQIDVEEDGLPTELLFKRNKVVLDSREGIKKQTRIALPKDANDIQVLDKKYNNSKTVYRNSKGRYASLKN